MESRRMAEGACFGFRGVKEAWAYASMACLVSSPPPFGRGMQMYVSLHRVRNYCSRLRCLSPSLRSGEGRVFNLL